MKKVLALAQVLVMLASLSVTAWSLNEAAAQRRAAREAANEAARLQAAYEAAAERADSLEQQLRGGPAAVQPEPGTAGGPYTREEADALAAQYKSGVQAGNNIGRIWVEGTAIDCNLYWGDSTAVLNLGGGCRDQNGCVLPGENGTVFIGGHTGSYFSDLGNAQVGAVIHLETPWGDFRYQISETCVAEQTDTAACYWGDTRPRCILHAGYPFGELEEVSQRYLVYADPVAADEQGPLPFAAGAQ